MKRLSIICFGLILGILVGYFLPKQVKVAEIEQPEQIPVEITETVQYVEIITVEEEMEVPLPEADEIPGNTSGFIQLDVPLDPEIQEYVYEQCVYYNIDYFLVMALIQHESEFISDVVSGTGDYGLMQINTCNHKDGVDYLDPYQNIQEGMMLLDALFMTYNDPALVLMAYNMGEKGASRLWDQGIYTSNYVNEIFEIQMELYESITERDSE